MIWPQLYLNPLGFVFQTSLQVTGAGVGTTVGGLGETAGPNVGAGVGAAETGPQGPHAEYFCAASAIATSSLILLR